MAKKDDIDEKTAQAPTEEGTATSGQPQQTEQPEADDNSEVLSTIEKMKRHAKESDEAPAGSLRFRDIMGGDYLWTLVRHHIWVIILIGFVITAYIAVRYQCQQDAIDIAQLEKDLTDARFQSLSSSSNLTRMSRQSSVAEILKHTEDSMLQISKQPPYIIEVPGE